MRISIILIIISVCLISCQSNSPIISYSKTVDGWLNRPINNEFYNLEPKNIPIGFIQNDKLNEAIILLKDVFYKIISDEEYEYFTGNKKNNPNIAYLVRSVNYSFSETGYKIYFNDKNNLLIYHSVLSKGSRKGIQKWPIILFMELENVNEIFTGYSVVK